jgi:FixJ family two-component response regulator
MPFVSSSTVALVDDDAGVRRALARLLRSAGFRVATFASAEEFLRRPAGEAPACLVADVHLLGMSGIELARALHQADPAIPVLLMTAADEPRAGAGPKDIGMVTWLRKPVDAVVLIEALARAIKATAGG